MNYDNYLSVGLDPLDMPGGYVLNKEVYGEFIKCVYKKRKKCNRLSESAVSPGVRLICHLAKSSLKSIPS